jgi:hypothetical protein
MIDRRQHELADYDEWDGWFAVREPERWTWGDSVTVLYWLLVAAGIAAWTGAMVAFFGGL